MTEHTPGPWTIYSGQLSGQAAALIAHSDTMTVVARLPEFEIADETLRANARLIAAAPELVEALEPFVAAYLARCDPGIADLDNEQPLALHVSLGDWRKARALLAKAKPS